MGKAGTGKTLLAIPRGSTPKRVCTKNCSPAGPISDSTGHGNPPSTLEGKMNPWMQPIFDNVEFLMNRSTNKKGCDEQEAESLHDQYVICT